MTRRALVTGAVLALALVAAGCGRKGDLEPPGTPRHATTSTDAPAPAALVPAPTADAAPQASTSSLLAPPSLTAAGDAEWSYKQQVDPLPVKPEKRKPKPHRPFVLDSLLN